MKVIPLHYLSQKVSLIGFFLLCVGTLSCNQATANVVLYEELFSTSTPLSMSGIGWEAFGSSTAVDISDVTASNTVYVGSGQGNPATPTGYLAAILGNPDAGSNVNRYPSYAAYESGLSLDLDGATVSWRMNASSGATCRVRVLIMVDSVWYVSNTSDTAYEYYTPTTYGTSADFAAASVEDVEKSFSFTTNASSWRVFNLEEDSTMSIGDVPETDLSTSTISAIGLYIVGGGTGRIDTFQVTAIPEASTYVLVLAMVSLLASAVLKRRQNR